MTTRKHAFAFIKSILNGVKWKEGYEIPGPISMKRVKLCDMLPFDDGGALERLERYEMMADNLEPGFIWQKRREYAHEMVQSMPMYSGMYA